MSPRDGGGPGGVPPHWGAFVVLRDVPPGVSQVHVVQFVMGLPAPTVQRSRHRRRIQRRRWAATSDTAAPRCCHHHHHHHHHHHNHRYQRSSRYRNCSLHCPKVAAVKYWRSRNSWPRSSCPAFIRAPNDLWRRRERRLTADGLSLPSPLSRSLSLSLSLSLSHTHTLLLSVSVSLSRHPLSPSLSLSYTQTHTHTHTHTRARWRRHRHTQRASLVLCITAPALSFVPFFRFFAHCLALCLSLPVSLSLSLSVKSLSCLCFSSVYSPWWSAASLATPSLSPHSHVQLCPETGSLRHTTIAVETCAAPFQS